MSQCSCRQSNCLLCDAYLTTTDLGEQQVCQIRGMIRREVFRPHDFLFLQGTPVTRLFMLKYGYVKLTASMPDGRTRGLQLGLPWNLIGIESLSSDTYLYSAEAATDIQVCSIDRDDFLGVFHQDKGASWRLIDLLNRELRRSLAQTCSIAFMDATERVASFLLSVVAGPGEGPGVGAREIELPISRGDMGEVLGITPETVSRVFARLRRDGVIDVRNSSRNLRVLDPVRLQRLGQGQGDATFACRSA